MLSTSFAPSTSSENQQMQWSFQDNASAASLQAAAAAVAASGSFPEDSAEQFKNIQLVLEHVNRVQSLTRNVMYGMENAYQPNISADQTAEELAALKQSIQVYLSDVMRQTGIGALPLLPPMILGSPLPFNEEQLLKHCSEGVQALYEKSKRSEDSAKIVSDLLGSPAGFGSIGSSR